MPVSLSAVHVLVDDPEAALGFYRDILGLTVRNDVAHGGFRWITLGTESQPEIKIVLSQPHAGRSKQDGDAVAALLAKGELGSVFLRCDDGRFATNSDGSVGIFETVSGDDGHHDRFAA